MCGIAGIYSFSNPGMMWPPECIDTMLAKVRHRGPDGRGIHGEPGVILGHTRLAIIDLSSGGHQPMLSHDRRFVLTYNGELYNYRQIRTELEDLGHCFVSQSDTEVLITAWQEWGPTSLHRFDGIFAFAMYDRLNKSLILVRDHLGVKPLFYQITGGCVYFASELQALFSAANKIPEVQCADLDSYFTFNYLPAPRTGLVGVKQLAPGSMLQVDAEQTRLTRYWSPLPSQQSTRWDSAAADTFRQLVCASVNKQTVSDVPLGLFLSGGLDSYAVAQAAVECGTTPSSFTLGFREAAFDESHAAAAYAEYLGISNTSECFSMDAPTINKTLQSMNELLADASCFPLYQLSQFARAHATVILAGDGGDELLAGYETYRAGNITPLIRLLPPGIPAILRKLARHLPSDNQRYGKRMVAERLLDAAAAGPHRDHASFRRIFSDQVKRRLYHPDFFETVCDQGHDPIGEYAQHIRDACTEGSYLTARQYADLVFHLPSILAKVDRISMAHGLEVRVPLLSRDLVEFCINLEDRGKRVGSTGKVALRQSLATKIPTNALLRPKAGFLPPVDSWFRSEGAMSTVFAEHLSAAKGTIGHLNWAEVEKYWHEHRMGKVEGGFVLLGILQFMNWSLQCRH